MSPEMPVVSIVTPSFNQGRFLPKTIESVLGQSYPRIEYIVMDGGSTDDSVAVLQSYGDRFRWYSEKDRGQAHAINKGFALSSGAIRAYLNSDDILEPDAVASAVDFFISHPEYDMVYGEADYIDKDGVKTGMYNTWPYSFENLMIYCCICQPAAFWKTAAAMKIGPFNEALNFAMDYEYWLRMARSGGRIAYLDKTLAASRLHGQAKTVASRNPFFKEIFNTCFNICGDVHFNWFHSYWEYILGERLGGPFRKLTETSFKFYDLIAFLHHRFFLLNKTPTEDKARFMRRTFDDARKAIQRRFAA